MQKLLKIIILSALQEQLSTKNVKYPFYKAGDKLYPSDGLTKASTPYHLYLVSDEEIKEGDWFIINKSELHQCLKLSDGQETIVFNKNGDNVGIPRKNCKLVIATTDKSLKIKNDNKPNLGSYESFSLGIKLPQISENFIKKFVESQGTITEVLVEYEQRYNDKGKTSLYAKNQSLKLRDDNTVIISASKTFTREEVIQAMYNMDEEATGLLGKGYIDSWCEKHL